MLKINKKVRNYFFELLIIIIGISISFLLNEWRVNYGNRQLEKASLLGLQDNLAEDTTVIIAEMEILESIIESCTKLTEYNIDKWGRDSLNRFIRPTRQYSTIPINDISYRIMEQTGESKHIRNRTLLNDIIRLYDNHYWEIKIYNDIDKKIVLDQYLPYFAKHFDNFDNFNQQHDLSVLHDRQFLNLVRTNRTFKQIQVVLYQRQLERIRKLMARIDRELPQF